MRISDWSSDVCSSDLRCPSAIRNHPSGCGLCNSLQRARNMICDPDIVIRVENLKTRFGDHIIHQDLNLEGHRGEILGVVGGSGSGKSGMMNTILGLIAPSHGSIEIFQKKIGSRDRSEEHTSELQSLIRISYAVFCLN